MRAGRVAAAADLGARPGLRPPGRHRAPVGVAGKDMYQLQGCAAVASAQGRYLRVGEDGAEPAALIAGPAGPGRDRLGDLQP
jgi:hypothetical protein